MFFPTHLLETVTTQPLPGTVHRAGQLTMFPSGLLTRISVVSKATSLIGTTPYAGGYANGAQQEVRYGV